MSDKPTTTGGLDPADQRFHTERINQNLPPQPPIVPPPLVPPPQPVDRGPKRPYRMLVTGLHDGVLYKGGSAVMLYDDEVGPQHELIQGEELPAPRPQISPVVPPLGLSDDERARLRELRAMPVLATTNLRDEESGLAAREHMPRPAVPLALNDQERERLGHLRRLSQPTVGEMNELRGYEARENIPVPAPAKADDDRGDAARMAEAARVKAEADKAQREREEAARRQAEATKRGKKRS